MHEINILVVPLVKKIGFNKTMIITWVPFAAFVGFIDTLCLYPQIGIPVAWLFFGLFHLIAAANNIQLYYQTKIFGAEEIEESTRRIVEMLKSLSTVGKITLWIKINILNLFFTAYGVLTLLLSIILLNSLNFYPKAPIPMLLVASPPIMMLDLLMFFPLTLFGSLILFIRRLKITKNQVFAQKDKNSIVLSVELIESILSEARKKGANYIQIHISDRFTDSS
ncbi:MAG: hypothetical protein QXG76_05865 [Candidatus Bathyarchaeia archaeon]